MKSQPNRIVFVCAIATCLLGVSHAHAKKVPPPSTNDLVTTWVGWADTLHYLRLDLRNDGTGLCCLYYIGTHTSYVHRITRWDVDGYDISITLTPVTPAWRITLGGHATAGGLTLDVSDGRFNGWRSKTTLRREAVIRGAEDGAIAHMNVYIRKTKDAEHKAESEREDAPD